MEVGMAQLRRNELSDAEWAIIDPLLPRKSRGVLRVEDRRVRCPAHLDAI
jgi:transposase